MWDIIGKVTIAVLVARFGFSFVKGIYGSFLASLLGMNTNLKNLGKWAVVTGATDGIGKAFCQELAKKGLDIVLISRTLSKLENESQALRSAYGVNTEIIQADFTKDDIYDKIKQKLNGMDIGVLVNNVGISYDHPEYFAQVTDKEIKDIITCNIFSVSMMSKIVLPGMLENKKGLIINVSSYSCMIPAPFLTVYGATKSFVSNFSKSLNLETSPKGVSVQCLMPGFVVSNMSKLKRSSLMAPTPTSYVQSSLKTTGIEEFTGGYYMHKLQVYITEIIQVYFPGFILSNLTYGQLSSLRARALKRKEREAKSN